MKSPVLFSVPLLATSLALSVAPPALAQNAHVATRGYVDGQVVDFAARPGFQSTIQFGMSERIENIAIGDSAAWQVTPNRRADLLFVKPVTPSAPVTNMTVVTDRHTYLFELSSRGKATPVYLLRFAYAEEPAPQIPPETEGPQLIPAVQTRALPVNALNFAWTMKGTRRLQPARVFDDGQSVYLAWEKGCALPAILSIGPDGKTEGPVNFTADGDYLVVEGFHQRLILRSGAEMATIETSRTAPADAAQLAQTR